MSFEFEDYHCDRKQIIEVLAQMLWELQIPWELYRSTWVITTDIQKYTPKQLSIFTHLNENFQKNISLEKVLWDIHKKYWNDKLKIGV
jgi:hypothetical protein